MDKQNAKNEKGMVDLLNQEMRELQAHQKQIEEMAKYCCNACEMGWGCDFGDCAEKGKDGYKNCKLAKETAEMIYNAGYRKIPENAVVLTREEYEELQVGKDFNYGYHSGETNMTAYYENIRLPEVRKETAEKIADWLDNEKGYCGLGYLVKQKFCTEKKKND